MEITKRGRGNVVLSRNAAGGSRMTMGFAPMVMLMKGLCAGIGYKKPHCHVKKEGLKQIKAEMDGYYSSILKLSCACICGDIIA